MKKTVTTIFLAVALNGCAVTPSPDMQPVGTSALSPVTTDYVIPGASKSDLFTRARNYLATVYGDSRAVIRVQDTDEGTIIGKGIASWCENTESLGMPLQFCGDSEYDIRFIAKDGKARLQVQLLKGAPAGSQAPGWPLPPQGAYHDIQKSFEDLSSGLKSALNGTGESVDFKSGF